MPIVNAVILSVSFRTLVQYTDIKEAQVPESICILGPAVLKFEPTLPSVKTGYCDFATNLYHTSPELAFPQPAKAVEVEFNKVPAVGLHKMPVDKSVAFAQASFAGCATITPWMNSISATSREFFLVIRSIVVGFQ